MENKLFLGRDPASTTEEWQEWEIQAYITTQSHRAGYTFAAGMEGAAKSKSTAGKSKATGQTAGEPDLRYYLTGGKLALIELKIKTGKLTDSQKERFPKLSNLGFPVEIIYAESPVDGWKKVSSYLKLCEDADCGYGGF